MDARRELWVLLVLLTTSQAYQRYPVPFYKSGASAERDVTLKMVPLSGNSQKEHRSQNDEFAPFPVILNGKKYIMMPIEDADPVYSHSFASNPQNIRQIERLPFWNRNPMLNTFKTESPTFEKPDDDKLTPAQRNRFTDWLFGLFSKFQKSPPKKEDASESRPSDVNVIHSHVIPPSTPNYNFNPYNQQQNYPYAPHPPPHNPYHYPYPYMPPNYAYPPGYRPPYPVKPTSHRQPPGYGNHNKVPIPQEGIPATTGPQPYPPYPDYPVHPEEEDVEQEEESEEAPSVGTVPEGREQPTFLVAKPSTEQALDEILW